MYLIYDQYWAFFDAVSKTLTASIHIEKVKVRNFRCVINLHNPTDTPFDFLYVVMNMDFCDFLFPFDQAGNALKRATEHDGEVFVLIHKQKIPPSIRDWKVKRITAGGVLQFEIPIWQDERAVGEKVVKFLHIGKKEMFWIGEATRIDLVFGYYKLHSDFVPLPLDLQSENNSDTAE